MTPEKKSGSQPKKKAVSKPTVVERRRSTDREMLAAIAELTTEVRHLRDDVAARPMRAEVTGMRRLAMFGVVALIFGIMQISDMHTEACGPGHRSEAIVQGLLNGKIQSIEDANKLANDSTPGWVCGLTFPTHTHDGEPWPKPQHVAGLLIYASLFAGLGVWTRFGFDETRNLKTDNNQAGG